MNLASLLDLPAMIVGDETVLVDHLGDMSYFELRQNAAQCAGLLAAHGVGAGDRVGILSTNRREAVEALFAPSFLGATVVPMNYKAGKDEASHLLSDSAAKVLFAETRYRDLIEQVRPGTLEAVYWLDEPDSYAAARDGAEAVDDVADVDDAELAVLLYTSGTTSLPKGVMLTHGALTGYVMGGNDCADGTPRGRMLLAAPLYHVAGLTSTLNALYPGRVTVLIPQFSEADWLRAVGEHQVTHAFLVPTMLARLLTNEHFDGADLGSLEAVTYGAAPMPPSVIRRAIELFPRTVGFSGSYGQTETTATLCVLDPDDHRIEGTQAEMELKLRRLSSVGRPVDDVEMRVVDPAGRPLEANMTGEVQVRTYRAMTGYWGKEEKTRVTIDDEGWVHTGDLGYFDDGGYLFLTGRSGDMIIRGGENVSPEEVEAILYEHPGVLEAGCVGITDEEWGERVMACAVVKDGVTEDDLLAHCKAHLAPFKRPERVMLMPELPRTATGKLLRRNLKPLFE